ncbi:MAG: hypothetical protein IT168_12065 [Bryobacterales bacterium]|nr:hypothetical protein [Bryobacterales bacterium]
MNLETQRRLLPSVVHRRSSAAKSIASAPLKIVRPKVANQKKFIHKQLDFIFRLFSVTYKNQQGGFADAWVYNRIRVDLYGD